MDPRRPDGARDERGAHRPPKSLTRFWRFLLAIGSTGIGAIGIVIVAGLVLLALLAPVLPIKDPLFLYMESRLQPPSAEFLLGTDQAGRDILSRIIWGSRASLAIGTMVVSIGLALGLAIGLVAGYFSRTWIEEVLMKLMEILASIPLLIWAIAMVGVLGVQPTVIGPLSLSNEVKLWPPEPTCRDLAGLEILMGFWLQAPFSQPIQV